MKLTQEQKLSVLKKRVFPDSVESFGRFIFGTYLTKETPDFHRDIYSLYEADENRIAIGAPRGFSKSTITDLVYLSWVIVHEQARFVLLVSDTYSQATLFLETLRAEFESNERLRDLYGNLVTDKWSEGEAVIGKTMVKAVGAGMKVRGLKYMESRPDLVIVDDLENDELVESKERREKLERWFNGALVPSLAENGRVIVIGTILHHDSLLSKLLGEDSYTEYVKRTYRAVKTDGTPLWPEHKSLEDIDKLKQEYLQKGLVDQFYREYMNQVISTENQKFKLEKIRYHEDKELEKKNLNTYITIDRAYSTSKTADHTGIIVVSVDSENNWYVRQAERFKGDEKALIDKLFDLHRYWSPLRIGIEQKAYEFTLKPHMDDEMRKRNHFFVIEPLKDGGRAKNLRIEGLVPRFESGSIYLKKDQTDLIDELLQFPRGVFDDLCLVGSTRVATPSGDKELKDIKKGDMVITPFGVRSVLASCLTGRKAVVQRNGLTGTADHPVFVDGNGFVRLDTLGYNDSLSRLTFTTLWKWRYRKLLSSMESSTDLRGKESIISVSQKTIKKGKALKDFMRRSGSFIRERKFRKAGSFIIKTTILSITTFLTWGAWTAGSTGRSMARRGTKKTLNCSKSVWTMRDSSLLSGTKAKRDVSGTAGLHENSGRIRRSSTLLAMFARLILSPFTAMQNTAPTGALWPMRERQNAITKTVRAKFVGLSSQSTSTTSSRRARGSVGKQTKEDVYNLTVADAHCFYANGVLVGNCDSLAYQLELAEPINTQVKARKQHVRLTRWG